jgi:hypothetical protein
VIGVVRREPDQFHREVLRHVADLANEHSDSPAARASQVVTRCQILGRALP